MSMVTAIEILDKSPVLVSADDSGKVKLWDIRNFNCLQTFSIGSKSPIIRIIEIAECNKLCFLTSRVNLVDF
jgi:WD40 repeat protein